MGRDHRLPGVVEMQCEAEGCIWDGRVAQVCHPSCLPGLQAAGNRVTSWRRVGR